MRLKRYKSNAQISGKTYQPRLPEGALSKYWEGIQKLGEGVSALGGAIQRQKALNDELDEANQTQEISGNLAIELSDAFNEEALNTDHETLVDRYRYRAELLLDQHTKDIKNPRVQAAVKSNYGQIFIRHMSRMQDLRDQYWKDNTLAGLNRTIRNNTQAAIGEADPALYNRYLQTTITQIDLNQSRGVIDAVDAQKIKYQFLHDVEYGKIKGIIDADPMQAYKDLKAGEYPNLNPKLRPNIIEEARNAAYTEITRANAINEHRWKVWDRTRKLQEEQTFSSYIVKAREGALKDSEVKYAQDKGWLRGDKLKAVYKFMDEHDTGKVGDIDLYNNLKVTVAAGHLNDGQPIIDAFINNRLNGKQTAELLGDLDKMKYSSDAYKWGAKEIDNLFVKGPFDFGTATVRKMRRLAIAEYRERVIDRGEDAVNVATELTNRYDDWRKKRKSGDLLPLEIQKNPALLDQWLKQGVVGKYTYNSWKILLQQMDIAGQLQKESKTKTGGQQ